MGVGLAIGAGVGAAAGGVSSAIVQGVSNKAAQTERDRAGSFARSMPGMLGPFGLIGTGNYNRFKRHVSELLNYPEFLDSDQFDNRNKLVAPLTSAEQNLINQAIRFGSQPVPGELELQEFSRSLLSGETLPGRGQANPFTTPIVESISRRSRDARDDATRSFSRGASGLLGGSAAGAGSAVEPLADINEQFQLSETDAINTFLGQLFDAERGRQLAVAQNPDASLLFPFRRLGATEEFAKIPRELEDLAITRSFDVFNSDRNFDLGLGTNMLNALVRSGSVPPPTAGRLAAAPNLSGLGEGVGSLIDAYNQSRGGQQAPQSAGQTPIDLSPYLDLSGVTGAQNFTTLDIGSFGGGGIDASNFGGETFSNTSDFERSIDLLAGF